MKVFTKAQKQVLKAAGLKAEMKAAKEALKNQPAFIANNFKFDSLQEVHDFIFIGAPSMAHKVVFYGEVVEAVFTDLNNYEAFVGEYGSEEGAQYNPTETTLGEHLSQQLQQAIAYWLYMNDLGLIAETLYDNDSI